MLAIMRIPYGNKNEAKEIAKNNGCALFFDSMTKTWEFRGRIVPHELIDYIIPGTLVEEDNLPTKVAKVFSASEMLNNAGAINPVKPAPNSYKKAIVPAHKEQIYIPDNSMQETAKGVEQIITKNLREPVPKVAVESEKKTRKKTSNTLTQDSVLPAIKMVKKTTGEYYQYVLDLPFEMRNLISHFGGSYHSEFKTYILKARELPDLLYPYRSQPYSYEAWIEKFLNAGVVRDEIYQLFATENIFIPRDYQKEAKVAITKAYKGDLGGFLLADEVGLGKTISAGIFAQEKVFKTILIVTTLSAVAHWRKTFLKLFFPEHDIMIINYDRLQKLFKTTEGKTKAKTKKAKNKRVANSGIAPVFDLVVFDESHKLRNNTAMRSKLALKISDNANFTLYLSATAGQNPLELSYLAPLLAKITGQSVSSMDDFEVWCKSMDLGVKRAEFGKWVWDGSDQSIDKIHNLLFKGSPPAALRRIPSDIAGYPEISRELMPFELNPEEWQQYNLAWQEFKRVIKEESSGKIKKGDKENSLVARLRLRQKASFLKIPYTLETVESLLENGHQVAVSVAFKDTLRELETKLNKMGITCSTIHGEHSPGEKEKQRVDFQTGVNKVVLFTVEEAISLHQGEMNNIPRTMLIHDLRWSAISMSQIEGRTHRDGKFSQIYWLYFADSIEGDIGKIVLSRVISMKAMVGDDTKVLKEIEALLLKKSISEY